MLEAVWATGFDGDPDHRAEQLGAFAAVLPHVFDVRRTGSPAIDLCHVAEGSVDGFWEIGLAHWDYAAGRAVVANAGGVTFAIDVAPWHGPLVIAGGRELVSEMLELLADAGVPVAALPPS